MLAPFTCLIGVNGAGKSTILQALDLISQLMIGKLDQWLEWRGWQAGDMHSRLSSGAPQFVLDYRKRDGKKITWEAQFRRGSLICSKEVLRNENGKILFEADNPLALTLPKLANDPIRLSNWPRKYRIFSTDQYITESKIDFHYQGSILAHLLDEKLPPELREFRDALRNIRSLELLAPNLMRKPSRTADVDIGPGGEKLSAYLHGFKGETKHRLLHLLQTFYPQLLDFRVQQQRAGWKRLLVKETWAGKILETEARHINDGLLRILAVLAQTESDRSMLLFDEIENGINPEIIERLVDTLVGLPRQVLVTSHSPMILNYLQDEVARHSVQFVYRGRDGGTRSRPFFSLPRIGEKLSYMGPGEAFVDTDLNALTDECIALDEQDAS